MRLLLDRAPAINHAGRHPQIILLFLKKRSVDVIDLEYTPGKSRGKVAVNASTQDDRPLGVAFTVGQVYERPALADQKVSEEHFISPLIEELRSHCQITQVQLGIVLPAQFRLDAESLNKIVSRSEVVAIQIGEVGKAERRAVKPGVRIASEDLHPWKVLRSRGYAPADDEQQKQNCGSHSREPVGLDSVLRLSPWQLDFSRIFDGQTNQGNSRLANFHGIFLESPTQTQLPMDVVRIRNRAMKSDAGSRSRHKIQACAYFTAMAPTRDSKILNPSVPPNSGSLERSGCGIMPSTFRPGLQIPAILSKDPFGLASGVISPDGEQ